MGCFAVSKVLIIYIYFCILYNLCTSVSHGQCLTNSTKNVLTTLGLSMLSVLSLGMDKNQMVNDTVTGKWKAVSDIWCVVIGTR